MKPTHYLRSYPVIAIQNDGTKKFYLNLLKIFLDVIRNNIQHIELIYTQTTYITTEKPTTEVKIEYYNNKKTMYIKEHEFLVYNITTKELTVHSQEDFDNRYVRGLL